MKNTSACLVLAGACLVGSGTSALAADGLRACHEVAQLDLPAAAARTALFVVIDQTVILDDTLRGGLVDAVRPFLQPGNAVSVMQFSAFVQGRYTAQRAGLAFSPELPVAQRNDIGKAVLRKYDGCVKAQLAEGGRQIGEALGRSLDESSFDVSRSDILSSLKEISNKVRSSPASEKVVLLSSDMLENSSITSFYAKQQVKTIDPAQELKKVADNNLFADFGGARVYVMGTGLLPRTVKGSYRDPKSMQALESFWREYFERSGARLVEFGKPALLSPVR